MSKLIVGMVVSKQSLIVSGGIGQFIKALIELLDPIATVHLIVDLPPKSLGVLSGYRAVGWDERIWTPEVPLSYAAYTDSLENRHEDGINLEKSINFRNATLNALQHGIEFDALILNNAETILPILSLGLAKYIPVLFYTHNEAFISGSAKYSPYSKEYVGLYASLLSSQQFLVGTQSKENQDLSKERFWRNDLVLPMPIPNYSLHVKTLQQPKLPERRGILYIGRWEEGKDPEAFFQVLKQSGEPGIIMTNATGERKFIEAGKKFAVKLEVYVDVDGQQKIDLMTRCKLAFNPSKVESFGYAAFETSLYMPTILGEEYKWTITFTSRPNIIRCSKGEQLRNISRASYYSDLYSPTEMLTGIEKYQAAAFAAWKAVLTESAPSLIGKKLPHLKPEISNRIEEW